MVDKKDFILKHERILSRIYRLFGRNKITAAPDNNIIINNAFLKKCQISINGHGNTLEIAKGLTRLTNCQITICHSNCHIKIGERSNLNYCNLYIEDNNGKIIIGDHVTTTGQTDIAVIEGTTVNIGDDCLFATDISIRTGDSHSIIDTETNCRINPSQDVTIGNHVWIGHGVKILKGVTISDNSIIATGAICTNKRFPCNSILGGIPAKVLKSGITWKAQRIQISKQ